MRRHLRTILLTTVVIAAVAAIIALAIGGWQWAGSGREDLAQWLPATASVATLAAAIVAAVYAAGAFRLERDREERWTRSQERAQAESIAAWGECGVETFADLTGEPRAQVKVIGLVTVRNPSALPIFGVRLWVKVRSETKELNRRDWDLDERYERLPLLEPDSSRKVRLQSLDIWVSTADLDRSKPAPETRAYLEVSVMFRDASGAIWHRDGRGRLRLVQAAPKE